jgi:hypothetical protein
MKAISGHNRSAIGAIADTPSSATPLAARRLHAVGRREQGKGQFSAEIPCYRELTGNFAFFGCANGAWQGLQTAEFGHFSEKGAFRNREFGIVEQGIRNDGTGNTIPRNREYEMAEQGIWNG